LAALATLDNFNRTTSARLGANNWAQLPAAGATAIHVQDLQGASTGVALCDNTATPPACGPNGGVAYWNPSTGTQIFGSRQAARFVFSTVNVDGSGLILKATGGTTAAPLSFIRVQYAGGMASVSTTINGGASYTTVGALFVYGSGFQLGDTMTATVDATGLVTVWQNSTYLGSEQLPTLAPWTGGGRIGIQLSPATEVDNFAGANF